MTAGARWIAIGTIMLFAGCAPLITQSPGEGLSPVNAIRDGDDKHLILAGHDVVSYFSEGSHHLGQPQFRSVYKGVTFRFSSAANKALFDAQPEKYVPQFGGYCANGILYGIPWGGDANTWRIIDGKLYIFGGETSRDAFLLDSKTNVALADRYWKDEVQGSNAFTQRLYRLVMRVPHYKSGAETAQQAEQARAKGLTR